MQNLPILKRFDVKTPLGVVHLVSFRKTGVNHREVILQVLSEVSGCSLALEDIVQSEEHPRPEIPAVDFDVNWTHSGDVCVLAYGERGTKACAGSGLQLGVDYEVHKLNRVKIADRFFSSDEVAFLKTVGQGLATNEFYRLWCRKEALFKCVGGTFFEGTLGRSVMNNSICLEQSRIVHFCDVEEPVGEVEASLCIAVCK